MNWELVNSPAKYNAIIGKVKEITPRPIVTFPTNFSNIQCKSDYPFLVLVDRGMLPEKIGERNCYTYNTVIICKRGAAKRLLYKTTNGRSNRPFLTHNTNILNGRWHFVKDRGTFKKLLSDLEHEFRSGSLEVTELILSENSIAMDNAVEFPILVFIYTKTFRRRAGQAYSIPKCAFINKSIAKKLVYCKKPDRTSMPSVNEHLGSVIRDFRINTAIGRLINDNF